MDFIRHFEQEAVRDAQWECWFDEVYDETKESVFRYIYIHLDDVSYAEDVFQEVYTSLYQRILRRGKADIKNPAAFLMKTARREIWRCNRKRNARSIPLEEMEDRLEDSRETPEDLAVSGDTLEAVRSVLRNISPRAAKVFVLYYFFDMTLADIARELGITPEAAKSRLSRARSSVRRQLKREEEA